MSRCCSPSPSSRADRAHGSGHFKRDADDDAASHRWDGAEKPRRRQPYRRRQHWRDDDGYDAEGDKEMATLFAQIWRESATDVAKADRPRYYYSAASPERGRYRRHASPHYHHRGRRHRSPGGAHDGGSDSDDARCHGDGRHHACSPPCCGGGTHRRHYWSDDDYEYDSGGGGSRSDEDAHDRDRDRDRPTHRDRHKSPYGRRPSGGHCDADRCAASAAHGGATSGDKRGSSGGEEKPRNRRTSTISRSSVSEYIGEDIDEVKLRAKGDGTYKLAFEVRMRNTGRGPGAATLHVMVDDRLCGESTVTVPVGAHPVAVRISLRMAKGQNAWIKVHECPRHIKPLSLRAIMSSKQQQHDG